MIAFEEAQKRLLEIPYKSKTTEIDIHNCIGKISSKDHSCMLPLPHWDIRLWMGLRYAVKIFSKNVRLLKRYRWYLANKRGQRKSMLSNIYRCTTSNGF